MRYLLCSEYSETSPINGVIGFKTRAEVDSFIAQHLEEGGLDWRVGYLFKSRCDAKPYQIIVAATGKRLLPK